MYTPLLVIIFGVLDFIVGIAVLLLFVKLIDKEKFSAIGLNFRNHIKDFFTGGLFGMICIIIGSIIIIGKNYHQVEVNELIRFGLLGKFFCLFRIEGNFRRDCFSRIYIKKTDDLISCVYFAVN